MLIVSFPEYYEGAGTSEFMLKSAKAECSGTHMVIIQCSYNIAKRSLLALYQMKNELDSQSTHDLTISGFKNPV